MKYEIKIERSALKSLQKIQASDQRKIVDVIESLALQPRPIGSKKLIGRNGFRIRIGRYRLIYEIDHHHCCVLVLDVGHRKDIYR